MLESRQNLRTTITAHFILGSPGRSMSAEAVPERLPHARQP
jgi:hypothetical protein